MHNFEQHRVLNCPDTAYYIPNFISESEEEYLLEKVNDAPKPKWVQLKNRRLQNWGGIPNGTKGMLAEPIPSWLDTYCDKLANLGLFEQFKPNHILVNEYLAGQGIMPHEDGPFYHPTVTTISLGSYTYLDFYKPLSLFDASEQDSITLEQRYAFSFLVEPRSLLVLKNDMYKVYLHGIKETSEDVFDSKRIANYENLSQFKEKLEESVLKRDTRVSLTIRYVPKVVKLNVNSLLFNKKN